MKKPIILLIAAILPAWLAAQRVITLEECHSKSIENHPVYGEFELIGQSSDLKIKNYNKTYLPELNLSGQASYQSDVTKVPTFIPQFAPPSISKDWYKVYLDVGQVIYDGGTTKQNKNVEVIDHLIDKQNLEIQLYQIKDRVDQVFFGILILQENRALLDVKAGELQARLKDVSSAVRNGLILASNEDILQAEMMKIEQKKAEIDIGISSGYNVLEEMMGEEIAEGTILEAPSPVADLSATGNSRLEFGLFQLQQQKMDAVKKLTGTRLMPRFVAFAQAGYGRPAFDMLNDSFEDYYIVGARLNWNFWNWNKTRNEKQILDLNKQIINKQQDAFDQGLSIELQNKRSEVIKYEALIVKDEEIVALHDRIIKTYASQLEHGVITATEYLSELNAGTEAKLNMQIHKIMLIQAKINYMATAGKL